MHDRLEERWLPDGGFEVRLPECLPVVLTASTYFSRTADGRRKIIRLLMLYADFFCRLRGLQLPLATGAFREEGAGGGFRLEDPAAAAGTFAFLKIPRRVIVAGEGGRPQP